MKRFLGFGVVIIVMVWVVINIPGWAGQIVLSKPLSDGQCVGNPDGRCEFNPIGAMDKGRPAPTPIDTPTVPLGFTGK